MKLVQDSGREGDTKRDILISLKMVYERPLNRLFFPRMEILQQALIDFFYDTSNNVRRKSALQWPLQYMLQKD